MIFRTLRNLFGLILLATAFAAHAQPTEACDTCLSEEQAKEDIETLYHRLQLEHVDLFARRTRAEYDAHIASLLARIDGQVPRAAFHLMLHEAMAFGNIGHAKTEAAMNEVFEHVGGGGGIIPLSVVYRGERMITDNWTGPDRALPPGSRITAIGGMPLAEFEAKARRIISADTAQLLRAQIELGMPAYLYLIFGPVDSLAIEYAQPDGTIRSHNVVAMQLGEMYALHDARAVPNPGRNAAARTYRALDNGIFYIQPGPFSATSEERGEDGEAYAIEPFRAFVEEAFTALAQSGARDLIIDLRDNGGGDASFSDLIIARLTDEPYRHSARYEVRAGPNTKAIWADRGGDANTPAGRIAVALRAAGDGERVAIDLPETQPITDRAFDGRVWVLVNRHSYSNAAVIAAMMQDAGIATILGEETADVPTTYGAVESFALPNSGATIIYPKAYMVRPSGSEEVRGVVPDFLIAPTAIGSPRDTMLDIALTEIRLSR